MRRTFAFIGVLIVAAALVWFAGNHLVRPVHVAPAPKAESLQRRFPDHDENDSAARFLATMTHIDDGQLRGVREVEVEYIGREVASAAAACDPPPERLSKFLDNNAQTLRAIRAQVASNPPPQWRQRAGDLLDTPQPDDMLLSRVFLMLSASALAGHSVRSDAAAWSDLGATWVLTRSLWERPEITSVLTALTGSRLIAAVATKLPPPVPPWWREFAAYDVRTPLAHALEYEAWAIRTRADRFPVGEPDDDKNALHDTMRRTIEPFARPIKILQADARARDLRELTRHVVTMDPCGQLPQAARARWTETLGRFNRFLIEREGVSRLLAAEEARAKTAAWPAQIETGSLCGGARWDYKIANGEMRLAFTGHMPVPQTRVVTPLDFRR